MATDVIIRESHSRLVHSYQGLEAKAELLITSKVVSRINLLFTSLEGNKNKDAVRQLGTSSLMCGILL